MNTPKLSQPRGVLLDQPCEARSPSKMQLSCLISEAELTGRLQGAIRQNSLMGVWSTQSGSRRDVLGSICRVRAARAA